MPYIIMKRDDIPAGTLQVLDMEPNTSLRNLTLDVPGQTKYVNAVENDTVVTSGAGPIILHREARGLAAWFITNVNDGSGAAAVGTFTIVVATPILAGDTVTVGAQVFAAVAVARIPGANDFDISSGTDAGIATELAAAINDPANGAAQAGGLSNLVTAVGALAVVTLTANTDGLAGNLVLATDNAGGFSPVGMAGGLDADSLTAAEANTDATDVLDLLAFGDLTAPAGVLDLAAVNGALTTSVLTAAQLPDLLSLLAGRQYFAPRGVQVDLDGTTFDVQPPVGAEGGPGFVAGSNRDLFLNDGLPLSFAMGELEGFRDSSFVYAGVPGDPNGEAVVIYNDDGTFFTP